MSDSHRLVVQTPVSLTEVEGALLSLLVCFFTDFPQRQNCVAPDTSFVHRGNPQWRPTSDGRVQGSISAFHPFLSDLSQKKTSKSRRGDKWTDIISQITLQIITQYDVIYFSNSNHLSTYQSFSLHTRARLQTSKPKQLLDVIITKKKIENFTSLLEKNYYYYEINFLLWSDSTGPPYLTGFYFGDQVRRKVNRGLQKVHKPHVRFQPPLGGTATAEEDDEFSSLAIIRNTEKIF